MLEKKRRSEIAFRSVVRDVRRIALRKKGAENAFRSIIRSRRKLRWDILNEEQKCFHEVEFVVQQPWRLKICCITQNPDSSASTSLIIPFSSIAVVTKLDGKHVEHRQSTNMLLIANNNNSRFDDFLDHFRCKVDHSLMLRAKTFNDGIDKHMGR